MQKTTQVLEGIMNSICSWLKLTMENEDMFEERNLPTLDLKLWVAEDNTIMYVFFEKEILSPMVLHKRTAMPEGVRRAILNQEMVRRMVNTTEKVSILERVKVVAGYAQKLITSENSAEETREVIT